MKLKELHPWNVPPQEARGIQQQLAQQVLRENHVPVGARLIAGADISGVNRQGLATGAVVVLDVPTFTIREVRTRSSRASHEIRPRPLIISGGSRAGSSPGDPDHHPGPNHGGRTGHRPPPSIRASPATWD